MPADPQPMTEALPWSVRNRETIRRWEAQYHPCDNGVSIFHPEMGDFGGSTLANVPGATLDAFRPFAIEGDDWDLLCDLYEDGSIIDQVCIRRQDLDRIRAALKESAHD